MSPPKNKPLMLPEGWTVETPAPSQPLMLPEGFTVEPQTLKERWKSAEKDPARRTARLRLVAAFSAILQVAQKKSHVRIITTA